MTFKKIIAQYAEINQDKGAELRRRSQVNGVVLLSVQILTNQQKVNAKKDLGLTINRVIHRFCG